MLINLSNHPLSQWSDKQIQEANKLFGEIVDMPFPQINPHCLKDEILNIAKEYLQKIENINTQQKFQKAQTDDGVFAGSQVTVHVMGELTFCVCIIELLKQKGIRCVASTTERNVIEQEAGKKTLLFNFVQFRDYF